MQCYDDDALQTPATFFLFFLMLLYFFFYYNYNDDDDEEERRSKNYTEAVRKGEFWWNVTDLRGD